MRKIIITEQLKAICPNIALGYVECKVQVKDTAKELWEEIESTCKGLGNTLEISDISSIKSIKEARRTYKKLGHDPTRYRLSSESLLRRVVKGKELYKVNNVVDINNLISIKSFNPVCSYDLEKIRGSISFTIGEEGEVYEGIGRGLLKIENLPVFADERGKFGSTTSDSERTKITKGTQSIVMLIVSYNGSEKLLDYVQEAVTFLRIFANGREFSLDIIT